MKMFCLRNQQKINNFSETGSLAGTIQKQCQDREGKTGSGETGSPESCRGETH